jgi:hypothetical protein
MNANMMAMMLFLVSDVEREDIQHAYIKYGNTIISLN